jgi:DNA-binding FadR family transcriptional regulator
MKMLGDVMDQLGKATPDSAMSDKDKMVWMQKHQAIVADVLSQMRREHAMMFSQSHNLN